MRYLPKGVVPLDSKRGPSSAPDASGPLAGGEPIRRISSNLTGVPSEEPEAESSHGRPTSTWLATSAADPGHRAVHRRRHGDWPRHRMPGAGEQRPRRRSICPEERSRGRGHEGVRPTVRLMRRSTGLGACSSRPGDVRRTASGRHSAHERHRSHRPRQAIRRPHRGGRRVLHRRGGRDLRHPRPQRRRQDDDRGVHQRPAHTGLGHHPGARARPAPGPRRAPSRRRRPAPAAASCPTRCESGKRSTCMRRSTRRRAIGTSCSKSSGWLTSARPRSASCRAARSNASRSRSRSSATLRIAILDELTTGLDPQARRDTWQLIEDVRDSGVTVILVTHFMEEAERLADRIALIDEGRLVALDTPAGIVSRVDAEQRLRFRPSAPIVYGLAEPACPRSTACVGTAKRSKSPAPATSSWPSRPSSRATRSWPTGLRIEQAGLDDAFVALTGRKLAN